jgi:hypothetical protein
MNDSPTPPWHRVPKYIKDATAKANDVSGPAKPNKEKQAKLNTEKKAKPNKAKQEKPKREKQAKPKREGAKINHTENPTKRRQDPPKNLAGSREMDEAQLESTIAPFVSSGRVRQAELTKQEHAEWKVEIDRLMLAENRPLTVAGFKQKKKEVTNLRLLTLKSLEIAATRKEKTQITNSLCELRNMITKLRVAGSMVRSAERKTRKESAQHEAKVLE